MYNIDLFTKLVSFLVYKHFLDSDVRGYFCETFN